MSEFERLREEVKFLHDQMALIAQHLAVLEAREQVNDSMFSALILTHPNRPALREEWRQESSNALPEALVGTNTPWDKEFTATARMRVEHLNALTDGPDTE